MICKQKLKLKKKNGFLEVRSEEEKKDNKREKKGNNKDPEEEFGEVFLFL